MDSQELNNSQEWQAELQAKMTTLARCMMPSPKRNAKDHLFTHMFKNKKYAAQLCRDLDEKYKDVTSDNITDVTVQTVLTNDLYNDVGFIVTTKTGTNLILVEAQSAWDPNMAYRVFQYIYKTWEQHLFNPNSDSNGKKQMYTATNKGIPAPETYVIFTGQRKDKPQTLSLQDLYIGDARTLDLTVKMIYNRDNESGIISQYITFAKLYDANLAKYGRTQEGASKAIIETVETCIQNNVLREYLEAHKIEVITIHWSLKNKRKTA